MNEPINLMPVMQHIATTYHLKQLLLAVDELQTGLFKKKQSAHEMLEREIPFPLSEDLKQLALKNKINLQDVAQLDSFLHHLRTTIQALPQLTITLGVHPTLELIKEMNRWVMIHVQGFVVLDVVYDESLIAGAKIGFKGKLADYSVKKQLDPVIRSILSK